LHQADEWMGVMNLLEAEHRLAKILYYFHQKNNNASGFLDLPVAKKELAAMIGATPGTLSKKLAFLEDLHIIDLGKRKIRVLDIDRLSEFASGSI
jgi:CRP/FNR family transcriptional regulator